MTIITMMSKYHSRDSYLGGGVTFAVGRSGNHSLLWPNDYHQDSLELYLLMWHILGEGWGESSIMGGKKSWVYRDGSFIKHGLTFVIISCNPIPHPGRSNLSLLYYLEESWSSLSILKSKHLGL